MKSIIAILALCCSALATTINSANCSQANIQAAITASSNGDTVQSLSSASQTWNSTISTPKQITVNLGGCTITTNVSGSLFAFTQGTSFNTRITNGTFLGITNLRRAVSMSGSPTSVPFRIDHITFTNPADQSTGITTFGNGPGLIDHITATGMGDAIELIHDEAYGDPSFTGWLDDVVPGSANMVFVEDSTFSKPGTDYVGCSVAQSYYGARMVFRHNTIVNCQIDVHGTNGTVGARWYEVYENTWNNPPSPPYNGLRYMDIRAASGVVFNNHVTGPTSNQWAIVFREEDSNCSPVTSFCLYQVGRGRYPATPTVTNGTASPTYTWGNDAGMFLTSDNPPVLMGRDVINSANQPATLTRCQSAADVAAGCPVSYSYTPFTYPHPLQGSSPAPVVQLSPTSLTFGAQAVGTQSGNQTVTLTNTGNATLNIASIVTTGDFVEISNTCTSTLAVSASCVYTVAFFPVASGARSGFTSIVDNASGSPHTVALSGTGTLTSATLTPNPLAFGQHAVGSSIPMLATLTNTGSGVLTLNCGGCGFGLAGSSFAFTSTNCPTQLGPLQSCTMTITFNPSSLGNVSGTLTATNDASSSPQVISLTGIGGTAHYIIGKPGGGTGWGKIGKIPSPPNPPTSYAGRTDNCVTGTEVAIGQTPGCIVGATTGKAGSPMSFQYRVTDTNLFADNAPANTAATDPDFGGYVVLATDQTSSSSSSSFNMGSNGGYDAWNRDSTMLLIGKNGGATWVYKVDTAAIHAKTCTPGAPCLTQSAIATGAADCTGGAPPYSNPTTGTTCTHLLQQGDWTFSRKAGDENKLLEEDPSLSKIYILTINAGRTSFQRDVYVDFSTDSPVPCSVLPSNYLVGWSGTFSSGGDGSITKAYGGGGPWVGATHVVSSTETFIYPTVNNAGHRGFQATTTGTTGGSEPNWNSTCNAVGQTCTDGTVVWTNIGNLNTQGPGYDVVNYRPGKGCSRLNTRTGRVTRGTGNIEPAGLLTTQDDTICTRMTGSACPAGPPLGTVPLTDRWTLHEAGQPFDSRFVTLSPTGAGAVEAGTISGSSSCSLPSPNNKGTWSSVGNYVSNDLVYYNHVIYVSNTTNTNKQPDINTTDWHLGDALCYTYVWQVASTVVNPCIEIGAASGVGGCSGHSAGGYGFFYKGTSLRSHRWDLPSIAGNANPGKIILPHPIGSADHHSSSRNLDASDSLPFLFFTTEVPTSSTRYDTAGYAEDVGILPDGSAKMFRFNHNYNTGSSAEFAIQNAIGVISQDGKFTAFGSDWMGSRGNKVGGTVTFANGSPIITFSNSLKAGESVQFTSTGTLPTNFALSTTYWVVATGLSTSQFEVSASPGGTAITAGSAGSGTQSIVASTTCNKLRADDSPVKNAVITFGFNILPTINNSGQDIFQSQTACGATCPSTGSTTPNWDNSCPNVGNTCVDGGVTWLNLGPNDCRGDIAVVDLLSSHPLP